MRPAHVVLAIAVAAFWGANFSAAKIGTDHLPPCLLMALRFAGTAICLLPFVAVPRGALLRAIVLQSFLLGTLHFALFFAGLYVGLDIPSSTIVGQMGVPFSCLFSAWWLKDRMSAASLAGMVLALCGIVVIAGTPNITAHWLGFWMTLGAMVAWGISNVMIKTIRHLDIFQFLAWMSLLAVPQLLLASAWFEQGQMEALRAAPHEVWIALAYTVVFSTLVAYGGWYFLLARYPVSKMAPYNLLSPLFAIVVGQWLFPAELTWMHLVGGAMTLAGVGMIVMRKPRMAPVGSET